MNKSRFAVELSSAPRGGFGEFLLARGEKIAMRYWDSAATGLKYGPVSNPFEFCGFVLSGRARWTVGEESFVVSPGWSWTIPADTPHSLEVLETFTAVEVVSPGRE